MASQRFDWFGWLTAPLKWFRTNFTLLQTILLIYGFLTIVLMVLTMVAYTMLWRRIITLTDFEPLRVLYLVLVAMYTAGSVARHRKISPEHRTIWRFELAMLFWIVFVVFWTTVFLAGKLHWIHPALGREEYWTLVEIVILLLGMFGGGRFLKDYQRHS